MNSKYRIHKRGQGRIVTYPQQKIGVAEGRLDGSLVGIDLHSISSLHISSS